MLSGIPQSRLAEFALLPESLSNRRACLVVQSVSWGRMVQKRTETLTQRVTRHWVEKIRKCKKR